jgi:hypothetical protein
MWKVVAEVNARLPEDQRFSWWWWPAGKYLRLWKEHKRLLPQSHWRWYWILFFLTALAFMFLIVCSAMRSATGLPMFYDQTVRVPDFALAVKLSKAAESRLRSLNESIKVAVYFDGDGEPEKGVNTTPMRAVVLGNQEKEVDDENVAKFTGRRILAERWSRLSDKNYFVTINVFSARRAVRENLLDCQYPIERIENIQNRTLEVQCDLSVSQGIEVNESGQ